ncbi:MAG: hypothetical protein NTW21_44755 [Verrucomicrobia bacterium]|nr:hypothetical protein [Verrucomicrobiota bacterium]
MKTTLLFSLCCLPLGAEPRTSANYTLTPETNDSGGGRSTSAVYTIDTSLASAGGITSSTPALLLGKCGFAGQLYDVTGLTLGAVPTTITGGGTRQLAAYAALDDATFLALDARNVAWSVVSGPLAGIDASGLATANAVSQDTAATARGAWGGFTSTLGLTVLATTDFSTYTDWQAYYFGTGNPAGAPSADPDGDGQDNAFEFVAGLVPTDPTSRFMTSVITVPGHLTQRNIVFQIVAGRTYTVLTSSSLTSSSWRPLPGSPPTVDNGNQRTVTDTDATAARKCYRVQITKP